MYLLAEIIINYYYYRNLKLKKIAEFQNLLTATFISEHVYDLPRLQSNVELLHAVYISLLNHESQYESCLPATNESCYTSVRLKWVLFIITESISYNKPYMIPVVLSKAN